VIPMTLWNGFYKAAGKYPDTKDSCTLMALFKLDPKIARKVKEAIEKGQLTATIWYKIRKVNKASSQENPHQPGTLAHDIEFDAEVVRFDIAYGE
jgi:hypothetical protein